MRDMNVPQSLNPVADWPLLGCSMNLIEISNQLLSSRSAVGTKHDEQIVLFLSPLSAAPTRTGTPTASAACEPRRKFSTVTER